MLCWQQSKVSKMETRKQLPSRDDIAAWASAVGATPETASDLLAMLRGARVEYAAWKEAHRDSGAGGVQADILELEAQTIRIAEFQPALVPGLLQTSEDAREYPHLAVRAAQLLCRRGRCRLDGCEADATPAGALSARQAGHGGHARGRTARPCRVGPTLAGQLDRLMAVSGLASLELCIIPFEAAVPVFPLSGFRLYDDLVIVESIVGEHQLAEADDVARYEKYLELLRGAASTAPRQQR